MPRLYDERVAGQRPRGRRLQAVGADLGIGVERVVDVRRRSRGDQRRRKAKGAAVARLLHVRAIREAEDDRRRPFERTQRVAETADGVVRHVVVDLARGRDQVRIERAGSGRLRRGEEVRVDGDAVAADARPRRMDVRVRLGVRRLDRL